MQGPLIIIISFIRILVGDDQLILLCKLGCKNQIVTILPWTPQLIDL